MPSVFSHAIVGSTLVACGLPARAPRWSCWGPCWPSCRISTSSGSPSAGASTIPSATAASATRCSRRVTLAGLCTLAIRARPPERRWRIWLVLALAAASHGLLDALTNGGRGVAFLAPFVDTRWHFPARPIEVSPIGVWSFFSRRGLEVLSNEVVWLWAPCLAALAATWALRRVSDPRTPAARAPGR